jgi:flagellar hook-associated protein 1 FlgK
VGTFDGLNVGLSALYAQRRSIDVTGQNIANVNTPGYSRQRVDTVADAGPSTPALFSRADGTGRGVRSVDVTRTRDQFLESRAHQEHAASSYLTQIQTIMGRIELSFAEPSDTGIGAQLADFWAGWDDVSLNPSDPAARSQLLERATTLASSFQQLDSALAGLGASSVEQLDATVAEVNSTAERIADLNGTIRTAVASGLSPNDLMDQRDLLVLQLSEQVGATARPGADGSLDVYIGSMAIVRSSTVEALKVDSAGDPPVVRVAWADDGLTAAVGGRAKGLIETQNVIIPAQRAAIDTVAQRLISDVNALHATGFDGNGAPGLDFFQVSGQGMIVVNPAIAGDPSLVAASSAPGVLDGSIARKMAAQNGPDVDYRRVVVQLGVESQTITRRHAMQATITGQLDAERESISGVNIDEEMTNLVAFQHAYSAAARFVTTVDEMLETLIRMV